MQTITQLWQDYHLRKGISQLQVIISKSLYLCQFSGNQQCKNNTECKQRDSSRMSELVRSFKFILTPGCMDKCFLFQLNPDDIISVDISVICPISSIYHIHYLPVLLFLSKLLVIIYFYYKAKIYEFLFAQGNS